MVETKHLKNSENLDDSDITVKDKDTVIDIVADDGSVVYLWREELREAVKFVFGDEVQFDDEEPSHEIDIPSNAVEEANAAGYKAGRAVGWAEAFEMDDYDEEEVVEQIQNRIDAAYEAGVRSGKVLQEYSDD